MVAANHRTVNETQAGAWAGPVPINGDVTGKDIISVSQFARADLDLIFEAAERMRRLKETNGSTDLLRGKIQANLFYEASTRTDASFSIAMKRLGGEVHNIVGVQFSSVSKGETLADTARILSGYADVLVLRHPEVGAAGVAAQAIHAERSKRRTADGRPLLPVPVINAGDGVGEHPTQALLDAFTIRQKKGRLDHLTVALIGDLKHGRTVHSLARLLSQYPGNRLICIAPDTLRFPAELITELRPQAPDLIIEERTALSDAANDPDVWYITRVQKERFTNLEAYAAVENSYTLDAALLARFRSDAIVMHPLPRVGEIREDVDSSPQAVYFEQAENGMYVRMALLAGVCGKL